MQAILPVKNVILKIINDISIKTAHQGGIKIFYTKTHHYDFFV